MDGNSIFLALGMTMIAGLSTGLGGLISILTSKTNTKFLSFSLGLSAGVMIYVSFMELMPESVKELAENYVGKLPEIFMLLLFFAGIMLIALIDHFVPEDENPHELHLDDKASDHHKLKRTGFMMALAIGIHNFPEGLATFTSALTNLEVAIPIVFAISIHNIPEGIAVAAPIYHSTGNKKKAFWTALLSGLAEPVGALCGIVFLLPFWSPTINAMLLSFVSGIMVYISFDELLPGMERYGHHHHGIAGLIFGMAIIAASLLIL